jgi:hypothetical protein
LKEEAVISQRLIDDVRPSEDQQMGEQIATAHKKFQSKRTKGRALFNFEFLPQSAIVKGDKRCVCWIGHSTKESVNFQHDIPS